MSEVALPTERLSGSYNAIDYRLRPAKHAERAMIVEAAARLRFDDLQNYRYVGFGSIHFSDFKLFHRILGITDFHSIEGREIDRDRFNWNRPFSDIKMHYGMSGDILPTLGWKKQAIVWLDYDGQLDQGKLKDADYLIRTVPSGTLLLFSVNAEKPSPAGLNREDRDADLVRALSMMIGPERVRSEVKEGDLRGKFAAGTYYKVLRDHIESSISTRNRITENEEAVVSWRQILHITYRDGARMLTVGGVVVSKKDEPIFEMGKFDRLSFHRSGHDAFDICVPKLTLKEMANLERSALKNPTNCNVPHFLDEKEKANFVRLFRYLPSFVSADL